MQPEIASLRDAVESADADGFLIHDSAADADQRYLSGFDSVDPFTTLYVPDAIHLMVRGLDRGLARSTSHADTVTAPAAYEFDALVEEHGRAVARGHLLAAFCRDHDGTAVLVPDSFPVGLADVLRSLEIDVTPDREDVIERVRAEKRPDELDHIRAAQAATERAMDAAANILADATIDGDRLVHDGTELTSERVRETIEIELLRSGCHCPETIVAGGTDAGDPHERGSGPLPAHEPIVIDVFPRDRSNGYHADMTRTFCVGEPDEQLVEWIELTREAKAVGIDAIEPGTTGADVHAAVCDVYEDAGIPTARTDPDTAVGFVHGTGHGVGLDVHELPRLSTGGAELAPGHVVTVEPGVYDPDRGGCRIEDLLVVTESGAENLTSYPDVPELER